MRTIIIAFALVLLSATPMAQPVPQCIEIVPGFVQCPWLSPVQEHAAYDRWLESHSDDPWPFVAILREFQEEAREHGEKQAETARFYYHLQRALLNVKEQQRQLRDIIKAK